jgi:hypothetical protein
LTTCHKIIWGNDDLFIAVGEGSSYTLIHSYDGVNWIQNNNLFTTAGYDVVYNNSMYLALGTGGNSIIKSTDAINWTAVSATFFTSAIQGIWDGSQFVIIGQGGGNQIAHTTDGTNYTLSANIFATDAKSLCYNGEIYIALGVGGSFSIAYSYDSYNWVGVTTFSIINPNNCFWDGKKFFILSADPTNSIAISYDGIVYSGKGATLFTSCTAVETNFKQKDKIIFTTSSTDGEINIQNPILIGIDNNTENKYCLLYSYNGHIWYPIGTPLFATVKSILWSGDKWLVASQNHVFYSYDLQTWNFAVNATGIIDFCYNGSIYIASSSTVVYNSYDGIVWTANSSVSATTYFKSCIHNGSFFIAVGEDTSNSNSIFKSTNGINWTSASNSLLIGNDICWTGTTFIACGSGDTDNVVTSTDGVTWTGRGLVTTLPGTCIACSSGVVVLGSGETELFYSLNQGTTWSNVSIAILVLDIQFSNNRFIATGQSTRAYYSFDGVIWYEDYNLSSLISSGSSSCISKTSTSTRAMILSNNILTISSEVYQDGLTNFCVVKPT